MTAGAKKSENHLTFAVKYITIEIYAIWVIANIVIQKSGLGSDAVLAITPDYKIT